MARHPTTKGWMKAIVITTRISLCTFLSWKLQRSFLLLSSETIQKLLHKQRRPLRVWITMFGSKTKTRGMIAGSPTLKSNKPTRRSSKLITRRSCKNWANCIHLTILTMACLLRTSITMKKSQRLRGLSTFRLGSTKLLHGILVSTLLNITTWTHYISVSFVSVSSPIELSWSDMTRNVFCFILLETKFIEMKQKRSQFSRWMASSKKNIVKILDCWLKCFWIIKVWESVLVPSCFTFFVTIQKDNFTSLAIFQRYLSQ